MLIVIIPFLSFALQSWPRFFNKYFGVDVWTRMIEADLVRKNGHKIPVKKISGGFILSGFFNYPPVFPWLLSFFSKKTLLKVQGLIAPIFDVVQNLLVAFITFQITGNWITAILAQIIYASIPLLPLENCSLCPRSLGYLNFTLAFYPLVLYSIVPNTLYLLTGIFFTILIFFTHKFATQSLLFITLFFTIFEKNSIYILTFLTGLVLAIVISKGYYFRIYQGHIGNILFWVKNYPYRFSHQVRGLLKNKNKTDIVGQIYFLLLKFSPITLIGTNLWMISVFYFLSAKYFNLEFLPINNLLLFKMSLWVVFFYLLATFVLSFKILTPIGEGQRYLEMAVVPSSIIAAIIFSALLRTDLALPAVSLLIIILAVNLLVTFILQWKAIIKDRNRTMTQDMNKVFIFLNRIKPAPRILCIPHQITTMILYNTNTQVLVDIESGTLQKISDVFPILKKSVKEIAKKYKLDLLVLKKDYASIKELQISQKDVIFESDDTQVIKI